MPPHNALPPVPLSQLWAPAWVPGATAGAVLSSPNTGQVPRTAEVALRKALPALQPATRAVAEKLEEVQFLLRIPQRKPYASMAADVASSSEVRRGNCGARLLFTCAARRGSKRDAETRHPPNDALPPQLLETEREAMLAAVPEGSRADAEVALADLAAALGRVAGGVQQQEPELVARWANAALAAVGRLEQLQAPGLPYALPSQYANLPRLTGRAVVELELRRPSGEPAFTGAAGGGPQKSGILRLELDGYSAPLSSGHFASLVQAGRLDGVALQQTGGSVLAAAKPGGAATLPLEVMARGDFEPRYRAPLDVAGGELPVLPLSVYGAVALGHGPAPGTSSPSDFFLFEFDRQRAGGLGGLSFDEGEYAVVGYVTGGRELLSQIATGDVVARARLVDGAERLSVPIAAASSFISPDSSLLYGDR